MNSSTTRLFDLDGRVAVITGGAGLLGRRHAAAIAGAGGIPVLADICSLESDRLHTELGSAACSIKADITVAADVERLRDEVIRRFGRLDILINNAANNPKVETPGDLARSRFEQFSLAQWEADLRVGLTGAFLCSQILGAEMARRRRGVILNIASDLALIAPDQRLYRKDGIPDAEQPVKPVSYSVVKTGLIGLTRYLATYWAEAGVRVNALSPGGVYNGQDDEFVRRLEQHIPLGRMAGIDDYAGALLFLCSDASAYMTGTNVVVDGGRTCW